MITVRGEKVNTTPNRFLVRLSTPEKVTESGIIIPSTVNKETDYTGTIVCVSRAEKEIAVGDMCVVSKHSGFTVETDDTQNKYKMYDKNELKYTWTEKSSEHV